MNFQDLKKIESPDFYLDVAFRKAKQRVDAAKSIKRKDYLSKMKFMQERRIATVHASITSSMMGILKAFPSIGELPPFYQEMINATLDYAMLKKSLGSVNWLVKRADEFLKDYSSRIAKCQDKDKLQGHWREFYGRISSLVKQIKKQLAYLDEARLVMKGFPTIKTSLPTVAICGFPNVGKTTLLYKLTGSKPEISNYAFTTKGINVAYMMIDKQKVQLLDTPGTLNRYNKMNAIEKQAQLAVTYCAHMIIYVFDLTETYPIENQKALLANLKKERKPMVVYLAKSDLIDAEEVKEFQKAYSCVTDPKELKKIIRQSIRTICGQIEGPAPAAQSQDRSQ